MVSSLANRKSLTRYCFFVFLFLAVLLLPAGKQISAEDGWLSWRWNVANEVRLSSEDRAVWESIMLGILSIFQNAGPLNPPQGFEVMPRGNLLSPFSLALGWSEPARANLSMAMWFPAYTPREPATASVTVWVNAPESFLGTPVLGDDMGDIYLLPPLIGQLGGRDIYSKGAHPPGYDEAYPSYSMYPLWEGKIEPFLRSVVRPTFRLGMYEGVHTVITADGEPFWKLVSQERWIRALQAYAQNELLQIQKGYEAAVETELTQQQINQIQKYMEDMQARFAAERIIENHQKQLESSEALYEYYKSINKEMAEEFYITMIEGADKRLEEQLAMAAELRKEFDELGQQVLEALLAREDIMVQIGSLITAADWEELEALGRDLDLEHIIFLAYAGRSIEALADELAGMSKAERAAPAYGFELPPWHPLGPHRQVVAQPFVAQRPSGLVAPDTVGARALVCIDQDYFNMDLPAASIQLIVVSWWEETHASFYSPGGSAYNEIRVNLLRDLWESLDWPRLYDFVE